MRLSKLKWVSITLSLGSPCMRTEGLKGSSCKNLEAPFKLYNYYSPVWYVFEGS